MISFTPAVFKAHGLYDSRTAESRCPEVESRDIAGPTSTGAIPREPIPTLPLSGISWDDLPFKAAVVRPKRWHGGRRDPVYGSPVRVFADEVDGSVGKGIELAVPSAARERRLDTNVAHTDLEPVKDGLPLQ